MERAAEKLSKCSGAGRSLCQQLDDGKIRHRQSDGAAQAAGRWRQAARVLAADHGSKPEGGERTEQRGRRDQRQFQEGLRVHDRLLEQWLPMVPGRRTRLRHLHGAPRTRVIAAASSGAKKARGFCWLTSILQIWKLATEIGSDISRQHDRCYRRRRSRHPKMLWRKGRRTAC